MRDIKKGSEYGGVEGRIQPPPHDPEDSAYEQMTLAYQTDPADASDGIQEALGRELEK